MSGGGWYYYAPTKRQSREQQSAPPASQIPGLNGCLDQEPPHPQYMIKDTDSKFIQLCKQGGRPNLLRIDIDDYKPKDPVPYPRVDWFYQDDIKMEEENKKVEKPKWEPMLPEYMVHEPEQCDTIDYSPQRLPYGYDKTTIYEREGNDATNKTVKIQEAKKTGISERLSKPLKSSLKKQTQNREKAKPKYDVMKMPKDEKESMSKILSYGYQSDWIKERDAFYCSPKGDQLKITATPLKKDEIIKEKELFKLSKFKNVPSKVSHQRRLPTLDSQPRNSATAHY